MQAAIRRLYLRFVLRRPWIGVVLFLAMGAAGTWFLPGFKLSAGTSTMILDGDGEKRVYDETRELFVTDDYVLVSVRPAVPWTRESFAKIAALTAELSVIDGVSSVTSPTNVPLFTSDAKESFKQRVVTDETVDLVKARDEMTKSSVYGRQIVSDDGGTFLLVAPFTTALSESLRRTWRDLDAVIAAEPVPDPAKILERGRLQQELLAAKADERGRQRRIVEDVRRVLARHSGPDMEIHSSGLPALVVDMVNYLERDIRVFGIAVAAFFVGTLFLLFRRPRFVLLPVLTCLVVVVTVMGATVAAGTETTVVTSNISSLLFIIGMAHSIHFVVKYREERALHPERPYVETIAEAASAIWEPCFYTATTTCVGFASILTADIGPVRDFALWMAFGTMLAFGVSLWFLPAAFAMMRPTEESADAAPSGGSRVLGAIASLALRRRGLVYGVSIVLAGVAVFGASKVTTDTNFVNYFRSDTEVHRGIREIDEVGGTMTLEVVLFGDKAEAWLDEDAYSRVEAIHRWFEARPETGKVLSLVNFREEGLRIASASPMKGLVAKMKFRPFLRLAENLFGKDKLRAAMQTVADPEFKTTRIYVRIRETTPGLRRMKLIDDAKAFVATDPRLAAEREKPAGRRPVVTGMFVLFSNMIHSLLGSQVSSIWWCVLAVTGMLVILFRHAGVALLAMPPNLLPIALVMGTMGFARIPLDLMTIMIASVSLGMAVDSSIHYVVRFREELRRTGSHEAAVPPTHGSIGKAILFTAFTVFVGFCVLVLSRFTPTAYFGLLTSIAVLGALAANLVLLPSLLLTTRPWRRD